MSGHPLPLRQRVVDAYDRGEGSVRGLARIFGLSPTTVQSYLGRRDSQGTLEPDPRRNGPKPLIDATGLRRLRAIVEGSRDRTIDEYVALYAEATGVRVSHSVMARALGRADLRRKKRAFTLPSKASSG